MLRASAAGLSLIDILFAMSLTMAAAGAAVPAMLEVNRAVKMRAAAAFISGYLQRARLEAVTRGRPVGVRFRADDGDWRLAAYVDGNGNGIRNADIDAGVDVGIDEETAFAARCPSVRIARLDGVPDVNGVPGGEAVRFGASRIAVFDADGSASSGSLYLTDGRTQLAVTVTPATGRIRVRRWDSRLGVWEQAR
ncbi:MAG TPA: GspH/FimT family pseudopilin [Vicinamibacterales bacterium]